MPTAVIHQRRRRRSQLRMRVCMRIRTPLVVIEIMAVEMQTDDFPYLPSGLAEVNKMIKEHSDLFSDSQCKVCSAVLISESQKLTHYQSKKHGNKVRRYLSMQNEKEPALKKLKSSSSDSDCNNGDTDRSKVCHVCNMTFSSPVVAESHYQGKVHAKNLRLKAVGPQTPVASQTPPTAQPKKKAADDSSSVPATDNNDNPDRFCSICQASFNNPLMAQQHYVGKKHRKQMTKLKLMETYGPSTAPASTLKGYPCTICNIELNSVEQYQSHISGAKHKNQVKKSGLNTAENQDAAEQSYGGDNQYTAPDDQYTAPDDQYSAPDDQYTAPDDQFAPGDDQFGTADADEHYTAGGNQYAPEDTEYSEEYQFT
ncbi:zinc finger protein 346 isoform X2 [Siniperca chuatsi]|uniref:zinc finger protein 346 isoform X2 n=1 Tax=Siniperca chuatsi TaxID=119488 RepID=UPI001CE089F7|nr:zinc finger protein 346 isoform X2 [Siniperca chuatsi]